MPPKNDDSIKKLAEKLKSIQEQRNISPPSSKPETISQLIKEGEELLKTEEKKTSTPSNTPAVNPYLKARLEVLKKYPQWRRNEIEEMEKTGNTSNCHYASFVKDVASLGDQYSY